MLSLKSLVSLLRAIQPPKQEAGRAIYVLDKRFWRSLQQCLRFGSKMMKVFAEGYRNSRKNRFEWIMTAVRAEPATDERTDRNPKKTGQFTEGVENQNLPIRPDTPVTAPQEVPPMKRGQVREQFRSLRMARRHDDAESMADDTIDRLGEHCDFVSMEAGKGYDALVWLNAQLRSEFAIFPGGRSRACVLEISGGKTSLGNRAKTEKSLPLNVIQGDNCSQSSQGASYEWPDDSQPGIVTRVDPGTDAKDRNPTPVGFKNQARPEFGLHEENATRLQSFDGSCNRSQSIRG
jgi:hypothetical protein